MNSKKNLKRNLLICLLAGSAVMYTLPLHAATSVIGNNTLPTGGSFVHGNGSITSAGLEMNVIQNGQNAVIKWGSFDVGGSATVNFSSKGAYANNFNTLNYVNSASASQIYGTINAQGGNIFIVNPAGVQIGNSAQINVGSLYVSSNTLNDSALKNFYNNAGKKNFVLGGTRNADIELMSLGNINANKVTFEGNGRIVIDSERLKDVAGDNKLTAKNIIVNTNEENNLVIGYDGYDENNNKYNTASNTNIATVNGKGFAQNKGYMWVEDVEQLQDIGESSDTLKGNYALRNSIDGTQANNFTSIGSNTAFTGKFDGIDYNIFNLNISGTDNVGLFGKTDGATINNVTLVGGSITGSNNVGAIVGSANNTTLTNVVNSAAVSGVSNVGGIVGSADGTTVENAINTGTIEGNSTSETNVGGLIGEMKDSSTADNYKSQIIGNSYNLGDVSGNGHNVGGLVGSASNSTIGNPSEVNGKPVENIETVYNRMDVTGAYNVGGIVGNMVGSTVQNAENSGTVLASGHNGEEYIFHIDYTKDGYSTGGSKTVDVDVANVGGIAGTSSGNSIITDVLNTGDVSSSKVEGQEYYAAGNVGGIVGKAVDTNISNATNKENEVRGAHNVGGIAGYFGGKGIIKTGINDGGDIMATGARNGSEFVTEIIRSGDNATEEFTVGNIGGVVGYMFGDNVYIDGGANRGTVHTDEPADPADVKDWQKAANVGGIVGKIDRASTKIIKDNNVTAAAVSNSYNTGDVLGYTGIGGIAGMMYNGEIAKSYNLGYLRSTRQSQVGGSGKVIDALNMGGIVGDTTEESNAKVYLYDVYNKGQIGDKQFKYFGRHIGGIVGRLSGTVEKAYNTGAIYNGYNVVGGIVGWMHEGSVNNVFNTGNITVYNQNNVQGQIGGIVGAAHNTIGDINISNAYNLGTIRGFKGNGTDVSLGGILGFILAEGSHSVNISNVYTTGNLYASDGNLYSIYGANGKGKCNINNAYYIKPDKKNNLPFDDLSANDRNNANGAIDFYYKSNSGNYDGFTFSNDNGLTSGNVTDGAWRIYAGNTPILNAFLPDSEKYFENGLKDNNGAFTGTIQYGTAYDPLLTIINTDRDLVFNFGTTDNKLSITNAAGLAVYGGGVTLNNFTTSSGSGYFGGTIYADGTLNLNGGVNDIGLGSAADIYGSAVNITTDGKVTIYGDVTATGNGTTAENNPDTDGSGSITITASDVDVYGTLTSASNTQGANVKIPGIEDSAVTWTPGDINNPYASMADIADRFAHTTGASAVDGNITINAKTKLVVDDNDEPILDENGNKQYIGGGNVNLYFGNKEQGLITTGGDLTVTGTGDVYVDSDLDIGGDLTLKGKGADSEVVLDITNIGQVQADNGTVKDALTGLHNFMHHFSDVEGDGKTITLNAEKSGDVKFTADMWDYDKNEFDLDKFDTSNHTFVNELNNIKANINGYDIKRRGIRDYTYIWISDAEQLNGIQKYYDNKAGSGILSYNFALKNDINASDLTDYNVIGTAANGDVIGYSGTFDGRGNRIIGLEVDNESNAGIFSQINQTGVVKDVNIYSGTFTGSDNAGAVAGVNKGRIEGIVTFGNTVTVTGKDGKAGGIVGFNNSGKFTDDKNDGELTNGIYDVESTGSVIAGSSSAIAGGLVGTNNGGLANSFSDSAVTVGINVTGGTSAGLGGVVGVNTEKGNVQYVDSLGVTNGGATNSSNIGGIIGINNGNMYSGYNESIVSGKDKVGGIIGENSTGGTVTNIVNATSVTGENVSADNVSQYVGGLVGSNSGSVTNGRNNGTITGTNYVGGMVGSNAQGATLTNLVNDSSAAIEGENYVGGIAGTNAGTITAQNQSNLINRGSITGQNYVGGVAGENIGTIEYVKNDVNLYVKDDTKTAQYFGGVAGINGRVDDETTTDVNEAVTGTITSATNEGDVVAENAQYVGGIVGWNTSQGKLVGMGNSNEGTVIGGSYVGGVIGKNDAAIGSKGSAQVGITNEGTVIATKGGAGGLIGENNAAITNTVMINRGEVHGNNTNDGSGTGGLIGTNNENGDITYSSLINEVTGTVTGTNNVGGLIGVNKADITGGRYTVAGEDAGMYINKIYNNGVINVGTYNNQNGDYGFTAGTGQNIGGLIGNNADSGSLTAGYNTGAINASGSTNVGGIAGSNAGTIDQVFNTVITADGKNTGTITGGTNVGGLVGNNSGTLSNAYNTTGVTGDDKFGNAVGNNTGEITNIYASNTTGILIGAGYENGKVYNAYSFVSDDKSATRVITGDAQKDSDSYEGFDFDTDGSGIWKNYDGYSNPLLKVFLTKAYYDSATGQLVAAADDFKAHQNAEGGLIFQGGLNNLWSIQIRFGNGNPNWLGYDLEGITYMPDENWYYFLDDAPFDRNKDFRERKAEVNFVDGGMEI